MLSIRKLAIFATCLFALHVCTLAFAQTTESIPAGAKVFVAPMGGFETYLKSALQAKKVPLEFVETREDAEFEITGTAESQKASTAKKVIMLNWHSKEEASIKVANLKTGVVVFAYSVVKSSSAHGKRSSAEACAKHLKEAIAPK
jgi:hypothetical protein